MNQNAALGHYLGSVVNTATPVDLFLLLGQRAVRDIDEASAAERQGDGPTTARALGHARQVVLELLSGLDRERGGELAEHLASLYVFSAARLHPPALREEVGGVRQVLAALVEAYRELRRGGGQ